MPQSASSKWSEHVSCGARAIQTARSAADARKRSDGLSRHAIATKTAASSRNIPAKEKPDMAPPKKSASMCIDKTALVAAMTVNANNMLEIDARR